MPKLFPRNCHNQELAERKTHNWSLKLRESHCSHTTLTQKDSLLSKHYFFTFFLKTNGWKPGKSYYLYLTTHCFLHLVTVVRVGGAGTICSCAPFILLLGKIGNFFFSSGEERFTMPEIGFVMSKSGFTFLSMKKNI